MLPHLLRDPTPGAPTKEDNCPACGKLTVWDWQKIEGDPQISSLDPWAWYCTGPLTAEERADGH